ncbi:hypothetical protein [[Phormidium] sp. ETS-05]|uniref:hypothetical protein n=1 Tax=[Phormidium] sp. ETS-05 TaxID=222819 RepID=UPI0018EF23EF|nr:hypothetical protein [[Phormidium] sp. ETS-05]
MIVAPPSSDSSIIQTYESANGIEVETILGNILVKSAKYPQGRLIPEGQRYSYPQDSTMPIDRNAIANSREMQDFLNPNNWSSPDLPPRVAEGIGEQLGEMRTALGQGSPVASSGRERSGEFILEMGLFKISSSSCEAVPGTTEKYKIFATEDNNQLTFSAPQMVPITTGTISLVGNNLFKLDAIGPSPIRWTGTFTGDGNYLDVTGTATCGTASQPFKLEGYFDPLPR